MSRLFITSLLLSAAALTCAAADWQALIDNAPEGCTPDEAPAVRFAAFDQKLVLGLTGQLKATVGYDMGRTLDDSNNFVSLDIPTEPIPGHGGKFHVSAQQTALTFNVVALPGSANQVGAYITVNLLGDTYTPAIEYALLTYRGLSVGMGYTLFCDPGATLPTIDYMGPCGYTGVGNAGVQWRKDLGHGVALGLGAELPLTSYTAAADVAWANQCVPDIPVALTYSWNGGDDHVRLSAVLRNMEYQDMLADKTRDCVGWGLQLSGTAALLPQLRLFWQATYGDGIGSYFQDYTDHGYDMAPDPINPGRLKAIKAWGGYAGLQYNFTDDVYMCAGYSHVRDYVDCYADGAETPWGELSSYTQYAVGNVFWDINSYVSCGLEYIYGRRVNFDRSQGHDSRLQAMLQFAF